MAFLRNLFGRNENNESSVPTTNTSEGTTEAAVGPTDTASSAALTNLSALEEVVVPVNEAKTARFDSATRNLADEPPSTTSAGQPQYAIASDRGIVRLKNEDAAYGLLSTMPDGITNFGLFILADGMGGHDFGEKASHLAISTAVAFILKRLYLPMLTDREDDGTPIAEVLTAAVKAANDAVLQTLPSAGTTLSIMLLLGEWGHFAHVGDSRIYIINKEQAELITRDHSYVQRLIELNQITPEEGKNHPQRNVLYRAIGQADVIEVDTLSRKLMRGASVLLCSDGLWDVVSNHQLREIVNNPSLSPMQICEKLCALAITQGSMDNVSTLLVKMP